MKSKIYSKIFLSSMLAFALIAAIPTTPISAIVHEGLMGEDQGGNATQGENGNMTQGETGGETGGMTEDQTGEGQTGTTEGQ
jgi:hypothetical protein